MGTAKILGNYKEINNDVELCRTVNAGVSDQAAKVLMANGISFTKNWIKIPFFLRERYHGASQIYIISTNPRRYSQARQVIDSLDKPFRRRLVVSNY